MPLRVLILGANGFIGSSLTHAILAQKDWEVYGMDVGDHKLGDCLGNPRFKFVEGDITISREWIEYHVKKCDAVLPLVAIANPVQYVKDPAAGLRARFRGQPRDRAQVREVPQADHLFPSTSEVYGDVPGPGARRGEQPRWSTARSSASCWIYACSNWQLLDRVIYARLRRARRRGLHAFQAVQPGSAPSSTTSMEPKEGDSSRLFHVGSSSPTRVHLRGKPLQLVDGASSRALVPPSSTTARGRAAAADHREQGRQGRRGRSSTSATPGTT